MLVPGILSDVIGFALVGAVFAIQYMKREK